MSLRLKGYSITSKFFAISCQITISKRLKVIINRYAHNYGIEHFEVKLLKGTFLLN